MEIRRGYKFRLYPTKEQSTRLDEIFGACRYVYNYYLSMQVSAYSSAGVSVPYGQMSSDLTELRKNTEWLDGVPLAVLQQSLRGLSSAYGAFFRKQSELPRLKTKRGKQSFSKPTAHSFNGNRINIFGDLGVKYRGTIPPENAEMKTLTVSKLPNGHYYASIKCIESIEPNKVSGSLGIDLGLTDLAITSEGKKYQRVRHLDKNQKKLRKLQQDLSRKQKGSKNRDKARLEVARLHHKIANQRADNLHKTSREIVSGNYELIAIEDLTVANMMKNRRLSRSIGDTGWSELIRQIEYKQLWNGGQTFKVDRFFPSSKQCSNCMVVKTKLPLSTRSWQCEDCGASHDRDVNAAKNILKQAEVQLKCGEDSNG